MTLDYIIVIIVDVHQEGKYVMGNFIRCLLQTKFLVWEKGANTKTPARAEKWDARLKTLRVKLESEGDKPRECCVGD